MEIHSINLLERSGQEISIIGPGFYSLLSDSVSQMEVNLLRWTPRILKTHTKCQSNAPPVFPPHFLLVHLLLHLYLSSLNKQNLYISIQ